MEGKKQVATPRQETHGPDGVLGFTFVFFVWFGSVWVLQETCFGDMVSLQDGTVRAFLFLPFSPLFVIYF